MPGAGAQAGKLANTIFPTGIVVYPNCAPMLNSDQKCHAPRRTLGLAEGLLPQGIA